MNNPLVLGLLCAAAMIDGANTLAGGFFVIMLFNAMVGYSRR